MSLEWSSAGRDWFFPSPASTRPPSHSPVSSTQYPRRSFSKHRQSRPFSLNPPSPPASATRNGFNHSGIRRRVKFPSSDEKPETLRGLSMAHPTDKISDEKQPHEFSMRWRIAILVATLSPSIYFSQLMTCKWLVSLIYQFFFIFLNVYMDADVSHCFLLVAAVQISSSTESCHSVAGNLLVDHTPNW